MVRSRPACECDVVVVMMYGSKYCVGGWCVVAGERSWGGVRAADAAIDRGGPTSVPLAN